MNWAAIGALVGGAGLLLYGLLRGQRGLMPRQPSPTSQRPSERVYVRNRTLHGPGREYRLTEEDLLWLGRALVGETGGAGDEAMAAVAWCLAQNFMLIRRAHTFSTFTGLIRAYSQPCNAAWANPDSDKCRRNPQACTANRIARRRRIQSTPFVQLPQAVKTTVARFAEGVLRNPIPNMVDFSAERFPSTVPAQNIGGNWFGVGTYRRLL